MDESTTHRPLGNYERYSLSRDTTNNPQLITYVATYSTTSDLPSVEFLRTRARELVKEYPMLRARVVDGRTTSPKWGLLSDREVEVGLDGLVAEADLGDLHSIDLETVISRELSNDQPLRVSTNGLLWRIVRYQIRAESQPAFLAVTLNHVISDGKAGQALFNALLSSTMTRQQTDSPSSVFPPSMESTLDCRPGYRFMLNVIWNELVVPKLPNFISSNLKQTPCWPGRPPCGHNLPQVYKHFSLDARLLASLKARGRQHQVNTLHPILEIAAIVALSSTFAAAEIVHSVPISVRDPAKGHPPISGNYVACLDSRISCSTDGNEQFWEKAREYSTWMSSDTGRTQAKATIGMLAHIPDGLNDVADDSPTPTGWETFLLDRATRAPGASFEISNLGYTHLPPAATSVAFAQIPSVFGVPLFINAMGHEGGLELVVCWRAGAFPQEGKDMEEFAETYRAIFALLAEGGNDAGASGDGSLLTFGDIRTAVLART